MKTFSKRSALISLGTLAVLVVVIWVNLRDTFPGHPVLIQNPTNFEFPKEPLLYRCIPSNWGWLCRFRDKLFPRKLVTLETRLLLFKEPAPNLSDHVGQEIPHIYRTNGFRIWIFQQKDKEQVTKNLDSPRVELLSRPQVMTSDYVLATLSVGSPLKTPTGTVNVGTEFSLFPHILRQETDLTFLLISTDVITNNISGHDSAPGASIHTNLNIASRLSIPGQGGILIVQDKADNPGSDSFGVMITTDSPTHKR